MATSNWTFVAVNLLCGLIAVGLGFVAAIWFVGTRPNSPTDADDSKSSDWDAELANQQALMASESLADLAQRVASDVSAHSTKVEAISVDLRREGNKPLDSGAAVLVVRDRLVAANAELQQQLERAERQIKAQAEQLRAREAEARTDLLTNLANRRVFDDELRKRTSEWERKHTPFTLLMLDIDHFKRFNDTHGHQAGDEVLRQVARILAKQARDMDIACRYGGEEFAVILPATRAADACRVAERIRQAIERSETKFDERCLTISVSIGVAQVAAADRPPELIRRADEALYLSKQAGRNCTHWHNGTAVVPVAQPASSVKGASESSSSDKKRSVNRLKSTVEFMRELSRLVTASQRLNSSLSALCIKVEDCETLIRRHGEFAVGRLLDVAVQPILSVMCETDSVGQTAHDELIVLFPGRSQAEASQLAQAMRFPATNGTFNVVDRDISARFRYEICQLLPHETAEEFLERARNESFPVGASRCTSPRSRTSTDWS